MIIILWLNIICIILIEYLTDNLVFLIGKVTNNLITNKNVTSKQNKIKSNPNNFKNK